MQAKATEEVNMTHTIRACNKHIKKAHRIDVRQFEQVINVTERKTWIHHYGMYYHPYKYVRLGCSKKCECCFPKGTLPEAQRAARRSNKF